MSDTITSELLSCSGQTGVLAAPRELMFPRTGATHIPIAVTISVGTATVKIEGRNGDSDAWVELTSISASDAPCVQWMARMRARLSAASGATVRVTGPVEAPAR